VGVVGNGVPPLPLLPPPGEEEQELKTFRKIKQNKKFFILFFIKN
jgi:hypothetical protein